MVPTLLRWLAHAALLAAAFASQAQPTARPARLDPLDANASVPRLSYESSLTQYRRLGDTKPIPWREANDTVTRIGGWRVYAREAQQPDAAAATPPAEAPPSPAPPAEPAKPMPQGHGGHKSP